MKSYTDLEQSKKLEKILPIESADMCINSTNPYALFTEVKPIEGFDDAHDPCWSLAALLGVLKERNDCNTLKMFTNKAQLYTITTSYYKDASWKDMSTVSDNPVDACYEMIIKLKEKSLI